MGWAASKRLALAWLPLTCWLTACGDCHLPGECDIRDVGCQRACTGYVACLVGGDPSLVVASRSLTPEEYGEELTANLGELDEDYQLHSEALALLGLVTDEEPAADAWIADLVAGTRAFYSATDDRITVIDRGEPLADEDALWLLVHELVHAFQDEAVDLDAYLEEHATTTDSAIAARSAVEGGASFFSALGRSIHEGLDPEQLDWDGWFDDWQDQIDDYVRADPSPLIAGQRGFPYAWGGDFVYQAWQTGGTVEAWARLDSPPRTTSEVMMGYPSAPELDPVDLDLTPDGALAHYELTGWRAMGRWLLYVFARLRLERGTALVNTHGWSGDRLWTFTDRAGHVAVVWLIRWRDSADGSDAFTRDLHSGGTGWQVIDGEGVAVVVDTNDAATYDDWVALAEGLAP